MHDVVKATQLNKRFGKVTALSDVSFTIPERSITGLVGRNGSGKTTLLKILAGILDHTGGEARVFGSKPMNCLPVLNQLVYTYHNVEYDKSLRLQAILQAYQTMYSNFDMEFAGKLMNYFELNGRMKYKSLSQGMGSIFNFLCALSCRAPLTMLDEPVLGMDVTVRKAAYEILLRDFSEHPRTFIISSHLLSEIEGLLSHILLIEQGRLVLHQAIDDVRESAYRIDGDPTVLSSFTDEKRVIARQLTGLSCFAIIYEPLTESGAAAARTRGLTVSPIRAEELCVYLTRQSKEDELECLW